MRIARCLFAEVFIGGAPDIQIRCSLVPSSRLKDMIIEQRTAVKGVIDMKKVIICRFPIIWLLLAVILSGGCASLIAKYDKVAYQQATSLKVDSLIIMDKAVEQYSEHEKAIGDLNIKIEKAYEYARGRPKNEIITGQWEMLKDPNRHLLGGFLKRWQDKGRLSTVFVKEAKGNVSKAFDQIIGLESGLIKDIQ